MKVFGNLIISIAALCMTSILAMGIHIPLDYYSDRNLPFGIASTIRGNYSEDGVTEIPFRQNYNMTINTNMPFTVLFGFDIPTLK